jgi:3-deoxy-D-manno-octulosonic acid kinase
MKSPVVPQGFTTLHKPTETWWIKEGWEQVFPSCLKDVWTPPITAVPITGGRGVVQRLPLSDGGQAIIRRYRRGGFVRHFSHDVYWDRPFRPFAELICTEIARQRGVPTVEILAAGVKHRAFGFYQGMFISREAAGFSNLWEWLQTKPPPTERKSTIETIARMIAQLHAAGILHADLNLTNILVRMVESTAEILIIDFDKARVFPAVLPEHYRKKVLRRLQRSLEKLDPQHQFMSLVEREIFCRDYAK